MQPVILVYHFHCNRCDFDFLAPGLPECSYGEFIMRSLTGETTYLAAIQNDTFSEVSNLCKRIIKDKKIGRLKKTRIFHAVFSVACDLAPDGSQYQISAPPLCPQCGSREIECWGADKPLRLTPDYVPSVTYETWNKRSVEEKEILVEQAIDDYISSQPQRIIGPMMRSDTGELAFLDTFDNFIFEKEVEQLCDKLLKNKTTGNLDTVDIFLAIFGVACDLAPDGSQYQIVLPPMKFDESVPPVTYETWNKYTSEEKEVLVEQAIDGYIANHLADR